MLWPLDFFLLPYHFAHKRRKSSIKSPGFFSLNGISKRISQVVKSMFNSIFPFNHIFQNSAELQD